MSTATTKRPRKQVERSATLGTMTHGKLILWLTQDGETRGYVLTPLPSDFGAAYRLGKATEDGCSEEYDVNLDLQHGRHSCECKGFLRWNHCKHTESLLALIKAGKLSVAKPEAPKQQPAPREPWCSYCNDAPGVYCSHCSL